MASTPAPAFEAAPARTRLAGHTHSKETASLSSGEEKGPDCPAGRPTSSPCTTSKGEARRLASRGWWLGWTCICQLALHVAACRSPARYPRGPQGLQALTPGRVPQWILLAVVVLAPVAPAAAAMAVQQAAPAQHVRQAGGGWAARPRRRRPAATLQAVLPNAADLSRCSTGQRPRLEGRASSAVLDCKGGGVGAGARHQAVAVRISRTSRAPAVASRTSL